MLREDKYLRNVVIYQGTGCLMKVSAVSHVLTGEDSKGTEGPGEFDLQV